MERNTMKAAQANYVIPGVKGFDKNMQCRGFQYKEGKTYTHSGTAKACNSGFHFCGNPLDAFAYYAPGDSTYHHVTGSGSIDDSHADDSKIACTEIQIGASISLQDIISASISFFFSRKYSDTGSKHSTGNSSASSATGDRSASSATGDSSASSATGDRSASSATGYRSASSATGYRSASSVEGNAGSAVATGLDSKVKAGKYSALALAWWNKTDERCEMRVAITGCGDGSDGLLKADTWYRLDESGDFVEAK